MCRWSPALLGTLAFLLELTTANASTFVVTSGAISGAGSIHSAIAGANGHAGPDTILFNIPGPGPHVIHQSYFNFNYGLGITGDDTLLDGYSQPGASPNTAKVGQPSNAVIKIWIDGSSECEHDMWGYYHALGIAGRRNVVRGIGVTGGFCNGFMIEGGEDAVIEGCSFSEMTYGVWALGAIRGRIGGETPASRNIIGGNWYGILVSGSVQFPGENVVIQGNYIGTDEAFAPSPNEYGIVVYNYSDGTVIGGHELTACARPQAANCISFNRQAGIAVLGSTHASILSNVIHSNGGLAIDIGGDGSNPNDILDGDTGPNDLQNAPTITQVQGTTVLGYLQSIPNRGYIIQAFDNSSCDAGGRGEGKLYIGSEYVRTNNAGYTTFALSCESMPTRRFITATATDELGSTSEFSPCWSFVVTDVPRDASAFALHANVPNPFNPTTVIRFDVPDAGADVEIVVFDVSGGLVRTLLKEHRYAGAHSVEWDGRDDTGREMASGVYFYRMRAGNFEATRKMVLLK